MKSFYQLESGSKIVTQSLFNPEKMKILHAAMYVVIN